MQRQKSFLAQMFSRMGVPEWLLLSALATLPPTIALDAYVFTPADEKHQAQKKDDSASVISQFNLQPLAFPQEEFRKLEPGRYVWPNQMIDGEERDCIVTVKYSSEVTLDCN